MSSRCSRPFAAAGSAMDAGGYWVLDDTACTVGAALAASRFLADESCGQCVPCRVGTVRKEEALRRLAHGTPLGTAADEARLIDDVGLVMRDASIYGLGQTAANAIQSAATKLRLFENGKLS